jgi:hypothetical protein
MSGSELFLGIMGATGALGTLVASNSQAAAQRYQAELARRQADRERLLAEQGAQDFRRRQSGLLAAARARRGAAGIALAGTPLIADDALAGEIALGEARIRAGGEARATRLEEIAALDRAGAASGRALGYFRAGRSLLSDVNSNYF